MLCITQISCIKSLPQNWGGGINGAVLGSNANLLISWVNLDISSNLSVPCFLHLQNEDENCLGLDSSSGPRMGYFSVCSSNYTIIRIIPVLAISIL